MAYCSPDASSWREIWFTFPEELDLIVAKAKELSIQYNVYFSSYLFESKSRVKEFVLPSRTIQADLDNADINRLPIQPTVLVESSEDRHQAYWLINEYVDKDTHETLSRKLTYSIDKADHSGWPLGRLLRLPETKNYKYLGEPQDVRIKKDNLNSFNSYDIELLPEEPKEIASLDLDWVDSVHVDLEIGPQELLESIKKLVSPNIVLQYNSPTKDRSASLWALMCGSFRVGLDRDQVFWLAKNSANNKFDRLRFHADRELAKDVLRAEVFVKTRVVDVRTAIADARKLNGTAAERKGYISALVIKFLQDEGDFVHTQEDNLWYVRRDTGRPIPISNLSPYLNMLLDLQFGLNASETEAIYARNSILTHTISQPDNYSTELLSYYDTQSNTMLIHGGRKFVYRITKNSIDRVSNGSYNILFPWDTDITQFNPVYDEEISNNWSTYLFGTAFTPSTGLDPQDAEVLIRVWLLFLLFKEAASSRPILAIFGPSQSGKSSVFKRIYVLLYGLKKKINAVSNADDFDHITSRDAFVALDNADTYEKWLADRIALAAARSDIKRRKLFTDGEDYVVKRQALLGVTAINPKFVREDVATRLILLSFKPLETFTPENPFLNEVVNNRDKIWAGIMNDVQKVLNIPLPSVDNLPQFRIEDFAHIGLRIAKALNIEDAFIRGLARTVVEQKLFTVEEESLLMGALFKMVDEQNSKGNTEGVWKTVRSLWSELEMRSNNPTEFQHTYHNEQNLGKKLWALYTTMKQIFNIEWKFDNEKKSKIYKFSTKVE